MTSELREMNTLELKVLVSEAIEEIIAKSYRQGKFDVEINRVGKLAPEIGDKLKQVKRDRIVEQAKQDVVALLNGWQLSEDETEFIVNKEKRTVVALMKHIFSGKILAKGIAKCAPGDCFNVHIGKAIALRRALGLEIPFEYLSAPQPTEVRVGDKVKWTKNYVIIGINDGTYRFRGERDGWVSGYLDYDRETLVSKIIDDSREGVTQ